MHMVSNGGGSTPVIDWNQANKAANDPTTQKIIGTTTSVIGFAGGPIAGSVTTGISLIDTNTGGTATKAIAKAINVDQQVQTKLDTMNYNAYKDLGSKTINHVVNTYNSVVDTGSQIKSALDYRNWLPIPR